MVHTKLAAKQTDAHSYKHRGSTSRLSAASLFVRSLLFS